MRRAIPHMAIATPAMCSQVIGSPRNSAAATMVPTGIMPVNAPAVLAGTCRKPCSHNTNAPTVTKEARKTSANQPDAGIWLGRKSPTSVAASGRKSISP